MFYCTTDTVVSLVDILDALRLPASRLAKVLPPQPPVGMLTFSVEELATLFTAAGPAGTLLDARAVILKLPSKVRVVMDVELKYFALKLPGQLAQVLTADTVSTTLFETVYGDGTRLEYLEHKIGDKAFVVWVASGLVDKEARCVTLSNEYEDPTMCILQGKTFYGPILVPCESYAEAKKVTAWLDSRAFKTEADYLRLCSCNGTPDADEFKAWALELPGAPGEGHPNFWAWLIHMLNDVHGS